MRKRENEKKGEQIHKVAGLALRVETNGALKNTGRKNLYPANAVKEKKSPRKGEKATLQRKN